MIGWMYVLRDAIRVKYEKSGKKTHVVSVKYAADL